MDEGDDHAMKTEKDYADKELFSMDAEEFQRVLDSTCLVAGVPLPSEDPGQRPFLDLPKVTMFQFGNFCVETRHEFDVLLDNLDCIDIHSVVGWGDCIYFRPLRATDWDYPQVRRVEGLSEATYKANEDYVKGHEARLLRWKEEKDKYDKSLKAVDEIRSRMDERVESHKRKLMREEMLKGQFKRYLELSDGDKKLALKFLGEVLLMTEEEVEMLRGREDDVSFDIRPQE
jgi:hypothetical protein